MGMGARQQALLRRPWEQASWVHQYLKFGQLKKLTARSAETYFQQAGRRPVGLALLAVAGAPATPKKHSFRVLTLVPL